MRWAGEGRGQKGKCCAWDLAELQAPKAKGERRTGMRRTTIRKTELVESRSQ